jgi:hypothetical protein
MPLITDTVLAQQHGGVYTPLRPANYDQPVWFACLDIRRQFQANWLILHEKFAMEVLTILRYSDNFPYLMLLIVATSFRPHHPMAVHALIPYQHTYYGY